VGIQFTLGLQPQTPEQAVVRVAPLEPRQPPATGFLISPDGYILTAAHVVCGSTKFRVRLEGDASPRDDPQQWREASLVPIKDVPNPLISRDLALLKIEGQQLPFLRLGDSDQVRRGDAIKAIGYPSTLGGIQATTQGRVTNTGASRNLPICDGNPELKNLIVTDVSITQGSSGGPLLRRNERTGEEEVIGIVNGIAALALATPINAALEDFLPRQALPAYQPQITTLEFPKEFFQGQKVEGQVGFWDANKDVAFAFVEVVELGGRTPVSVQQCCPQVFGKLSGEIRFTIEIPVTPSAPEQLTLRVTLLDLAGNQSKPEELRFRARLPKPEIIEIDFPSEIRADRQPNLGTVKFKDPNADVELARFDRVEGPFEPFVINLRERGLFGKSEGIIDFTIRAQEAGRVTVRVTLIDAKGLRSEPKEFSFTAQPVGPPPQPPVIRVEPDRLSFSATVGGANPSDQTLTITNAGGGTLSWTATADVPWLSLRPTSGTAPSQVTVSVNITGLTEGRREGKITITAPGASNSPLTVTVSLMLEARPAILQVSPTNLSFQGQEGGPNPAPQMLTITNAGGAILNWKVSVDTSWVILSSTQGSLGPGASVSVSVIVNILGLPAGTRQGQITISAPGAQNSPAIVTVTLTLTPRPPPPPSATPLGTLFDYTGALAEFGPPFRNAAELAAQHLNEAARLVLGGPLIRLIHEDSGTTASIGVDRARKLVNVDRVPAIVGSLASFVTMPIATSVTVPAQALQISPSSTSTLITTLQDNDYLFRTTASDAFQGVALAMLATGEIIPGVRYRTASSFTSTIPMDRDSASSSSAPSSCVVDGFWPWCRTLRNRKAPMSAS